MWTEGVQRFCSIPISQDWDWRPNSRKLFGMLSPVEISPHLCVGFLFLVLHLRLSAAPTCPHTTCPHTVAGVALGDIHRGRQGTWWHPPSLWRGRRGTYGTGLVLVARLSTHTLSTHNLSERSTQLVHTQLVDIHLLHMPIRHHLFSLSRISHPIFTFLLPVIGRSWHVGLSGPLIGSFFSRPSIPELVYVFFFPGKSCLKHSNPSFQTQNRKRFSSEDDMQSNWFPTTLYFTNPWNLCGIRIHIPQPQGWLSPVQVASSASIAENCWMNNYKFHQENYRDLVIRNRDLSNKHCCFSWDNQGRIMGINSDRL